MGVANYNILVENLKVIGYQGNLTEENAMRTALESGLKSVAFVNLIAWLSNEIKILGGLEEKVEQCKEVENEVDTSGFMMELSAFLKELSCPYQFLVSGPMSARLQSLDARKLLIDYLISELMCFRKEEINKPTDKPQINLQESTTANTLKSILISLGFNKPPDNITTRMLFDKLLTKMKDVKNQAGPKRIGKSLLPLNKPLNQKQWDELENLRIELEEEYKLRRSMLLTRLDVTVQSFQWSERTIGHEDNISRIYTTKRNTIDTDTFEVNLSHLLAARDDLAILEKTSNANVRKNTKCDIQKVIIGRVPDRGGRPDEHAPPPPEMPSWQKERAPQPQGGFGGGRGGQGGGGRGGFSQNQGQNRGFQQNQYAGGNQGGGTSRVQGQWNQQSSNQSNLSGGYSNRGGGSGGSYNRGGGHSQDNYSQSSSYNQGGGGYSQGGSSNRGGGGGYNQSSKSYSQGDNYNKGNDNSYNRSSTGYSQHNQGSYNQSNYESDNQQSYNNSRRSGGYQQKNSYNQGNNQQGYHNRNNRY
ncbi:protein FAM98B [Ctenocephalides felis]|uniref:protein FAM98B n=1 Tax=Ctenocephalides felis TaxID=7515 RepID=UPI000E6E143F|nr:protein FAM98B [Ctenocephalides felis]